MEERKRRFNEALEYAKQNGYFKTQQELADKMGSSKSSVSAAKSGDPEYLTDKFLVRFNKVVGDVFYLPWLLTGQGKRLAAEQDAPIGKLVPCTLSSSVGGSLVDISSDGNTLEDCEMVLSPVNNAEMAINVYGDSMSPTYPNGCRVFIRRIDPASFIPWGGVFVLDTINGIYIKEVQRSSQEGYIRCVSHNQSGRFPAFDIPLKDIYGMWRVLACVTVQM